MATRFLTEAEFRGEYGDAAVSALVAKGASAEGSILDAEDEALAYLRGFTDVPTTPETTSRRLKVLVGQLAIYNLYKLMASTPFRVRDGREIAIKGLAQIRSGELSIATAAEPGVDLARPAVVVSRRNNLDEPRITLESMRGWGHRT